MATPDARRALGAFLRAHRERLRPSLGAPGRRRTPGLRREEVAEACGASLTWIAWLEQGREVSASARLLARLAVALRWRRLSGPICSSWPANATRRRLPLAMTRCLTKRYSCRSG